MIGDLRVYVSRSQDMPPIGIRTYAKKRSKPFTPWSYNTLLCFFFTVGFGAEGAKALSLSLSPLFTFQRPLVPATKYSLLLPSHVFSSRGME